MILSFCRTVGEKVFRRRDALENVVGGDKVGRCDDSTAEVSSFGGDSSVAQSCVDNLIQDVDLEEIEVDGGQNFFGSKDIKSLADALRKNRASARLVLRNVSLGEETTLYLTPMLKSTSSIKAVTLEDSRGHGQVAIALALTLNPCSSIRSLNLRGNCIDIKSAEAMGLMLSTNSSLRELRLSHNTFEPGSMHAIAKGVEKNKGVKSLDLLGNGLGDEEVITLSNALRRNTSLKFLCLDFNSFGRSAMQGISSMLMTNTGIEELHLFGNRIDSEGAKSFSHALKHNMTLQTIVLSFNDIGDEGTVSLAESLTVNTSIKKLWLPSNSVGNVGLKAIGEQLPSMKGIESLSVGDFFDESSAYSVLEGLKKNTSLTVLHMESPVYDDETIEQEIDFYLRLNRSGRSILQTSSAPFALWPKVLQNANVHESESGSPDVLYYLLRQKPDIMELKR